MPKPFNDKYEYPAVHVPRDSYTIFLFYPKALGVARRG